MTAARVRVPNWRNVRSLALHRHGQSRVAEPFTVRFLKPELDADPTARTVLRMNEDANENARGRDAAICHPTYERSGSFLYLRYSERNNTETIQQATADR